MKSAPLGALIALACLVAACAAAPPLARGLPKDPTAASQAFNSRLDQRFPVGSSDAALIQELQSEGFDIATLGEDKAPLQFIATRTVIRGTCRIAWTVSWGANNGRIVAITGSYGAVSCLSV